MNLNILKENMRRFGTKNLSEQAIAPEKGEPQVIKTATLNRKPRKYMAYDRFTKKQKEHVVKPWSGVLKAVLVPSINAQGEVDLSQSEYEFFINDVKFAAGRLLNYFDVNKIPKEMHDMVPAQALVSFLRSNKDNSQLIDWDVITKVMGKWPVIQDIKRTQGGNITPNMSGADDWNDYRGWSYNVT